VFTHDFLWADKLADRLDPEPSEFVGLPIQWVNERLNEHVTVDQGSILEALRDNRYVAVQSCHDVGKSFTASRAVCWWLDTHPPGEAFVVTTAPTSAQVGAILWREIGKAWRKGGLMGYVTGQNEWKLTHGQSAAELIAYGRKPADYDVGAFQGIHARYVLVVIDEACGVAKSLFDQVDALATNENARVLAIGNPDDPSSHFQKICLPGSGWHVIHLDALRSPNFTREEVSKYPKVRELMILEGIAPSEEPIPEELREMLISVSWVNERILRWGVNSPLFTAKVRGQFPKVTLDTLINPHWVKLAQLREDKPDPKQARIGVDVARYGQDKTIIILRQGSHARVVKEVSRGPVTEVAGLVQSIGYGLGQFQPAAPPLACIDDTGVGGGVTDILQEVGYPTFPIVVGSASVGETLPNGKSRFVNLRSQLWWNLRELLGGKSQTGEDGWLDLDPDDDELFAQLTSVKYKINRYGQIQVESKDEIKSRGLASPDRADALVLAVAPVEALKPPTYMTTTLHELLTTPL